MAAIPKNWGEGGNNLNPKEGTATKPSIAQAMRDVADDLAGLKVAAIASADASDLATAITLVNEIKASLNTVNGYTILTTKA